MGVRFNVFSAMKHSHDNLILFDGVCNFCASSIQFIIRHDRREVFKFVPIQSNLGGEIYRDAGLDPDDAETFLILRKGQTLVRSDAVLEIATEFGGLWRLVVIFKIVPRGFRDGVYSYIAKRRYNWFGKRDTCVVPSENVRRRFLA